MSREASSSSSTMSAMLAEAVAYVDTVGDGDRSTGVGCGNWRCGSVSLQPNNPLIKLPTHASAEQHWHLSELVNREL